MEKFGSHKSLLVPCVQELAKEKMVAIPPRYTRPDQETSIVSEVERGPQIPVIDMQNLLSAEAGDSELAKLHLACKEWGFFQLVNHGVSISLVEKVKLEIQEFFNLPMSEKKKFWQTSEDVEGFGQSFVVSESQKLDWGDIFFLTTLPTLVRKPHLFPKLPLPFRETLELYSLKLQNLALAVIGLMGKALKMEAKEMMEFFEDGRQSMRMNYYPSCPQPNKVIGLTPHSDAVGLTILLQVNEVEGLQVKKDGIWVPVRPLSNAFILNIGDILEIITNGIYRSIEHRATVNSTKERLSIATFHMPRYEVEIGPAASLLTKQTPALFKRIRVKEYFEGLFARRLDGISYLDAMRINNVEGTELSHKTHPI
ncbi:hypothetical protein L6164_018265 [Bauhinia variegata]|uniref:Uncharacterized protein n=1 Tax=Bauhinia variegata TaxID=167791 RepID=A0ACB9NCN4_BAUVA|nr:hypothetical protein L6164_018265 [Bauhinia variegata]